MEFDGDVNPRDPDPRDSAVVLAARSSVVMIATPLGTAVGGPLVGMLGAAGTLAVSGVATLVLAAAASMVWTGRRTGALEGG